MIMMTMRVNACHQFWKDLKKIKSPLASFDLPIEEASSLDDYNKLQSTKLTNSIGNTVINAIDSRILEQHAVKYGRQPFIQSGWEIWKLRFAIDNKGKSGGLRIIFCIGDDCLLFVLIRHKKDCIPETQLEREMVSRIKEYISC